MEDRHSELNVPEVARTLDHALAASSAFVRTIDRAKLGIVQTLFTWPLPLLVHGLRILDVAYAHVLRLFRREESELNLLDRLERRRRVRKCEVRHGCGGMRFLAGVGWF